MAEGHATLPGERRRMERPHLFAIDGDPDFLDLLRELFQDANYHVTTTNFVPGTFDQIAALDPALLLVDLVVYEQADWELLARLRAASRTRGIPLVIFSTDPRLLARARSDPERYGGDAFIEKPFDIATVVDAVRALLEPARAHPPYRMR